VTTSGPAGAPGVLLLHPWGEVVVHRYEGSRLWFAEQGSPAHDPAAREPARDRVVAQLRVPGPVGQGPAGSRLRCSAPTSPYG
jgi:hypothetical protein